MVGERKERVVTKDPNILVMVIMIGKKNGVKEVVRRAAKERKMVVRKDPNILVMENMNMSGKKKNGIKVIKVVTEEEAKKERRVTKSPNILVMRNMIKTGMKDGVKAMEVAKKERKERVVTKDHNILVMVIMIGKKNGVKEVVRRAAKER